MANNNKKNAQKGKKNAAPKNVAPAPETPAVEVVQTEETSTKTPTKVTVDKVTQHASTGLDANHRAELLTNVRATFLNDPKAPEKYGQNTVDVMEKINAIGVVAAIVDEVADGKSTMAAALIKSDMYPALVVAANDMGITMPALASLPAPDKDGNIQLPVKDVQVSPETAAVVAEEKKIEQAGDKGEIELDPKKLAQNGSDEDVKKALTYIMIKKPKTNKIGIGETLIAVRDFQHSYNKEIAKMAENSEEALKKATSASTYEELSQAFSFVEPTFLFSKICKGFDDIIAVEKCPLSAFIILRQVLTDKEGNVAWTDEDIASALRAIVELYEKHNIKVAEETIANSKDKKIIAAQKDYIGDCKNIIDRFVNFDYSICEYDENAACDEWHTTILKARGRVGRMYFRDAWNKEITDKNVTMKGLRENISQRMGIILNLFRAPGNANANYCEANIVEMKESTKEQATAEKENVKNA